jgi:hypothetical protein
MSAAQIAQIGTTIVALGNTTTMVIGTVIVLARAIAGLWGQTLTDAEEATILAAVIADASKRLTLAKADAGMPA